MLARAASAPIGGCIGSGSIPGRSRTVHSVRVAEILTGSTGVVLLNQILYSHPSGVLFQNIEFEFRPFISRLSQGLHLNWEVIETAAKMGTVEVFLNFPVLDKNNFGDFGWELGFRVSEPVVEVGSTH